MDTQSGLLTVLTLSTIVLVVGMAFAIWKLLRTIEKMANHLSDSLRQFDLTVEEIRKTNAVVQEIMGHYARGAANVEEVTEGVRKLRKTLDAAAGVLNFAVVPVLGGMAGLLAGSKAAVSLFVNRIFRKEGRHGE